MKAALGEVNAILARFFAIKMERDTVTSKYEHLRLCVEPLMDFASKEMARLGKKADQVSQEQDAIVAEAEQLFLKVQYVIRLAKDAITFYEGVSTLQTVTGPEVSEGGRSQASRCKG